MQPLLCPLLRHLLIGSTSSKNLKWLVLRRKAALTHPFFSTIKPTSALPLQSDAFMLPSSDSGMTVVRVTLRYTGTPDVKDPNACVFAPISNNDYDDLAFAVVPPTSTGSCYDFDDHQVKNGVIISSFLFESNWCTMINRINVHWVYKTCYFA